MRVQKLFSTHKRSNKTAFSIKVDFLLIKKKVAALKIRTAFSFWRRFSRLEGDFHIVVSWLWALMDLNVTITNGHISCLWLTVWSHVDFEVVRGRYLNFLAIDFDFTIVDFNGVSFKSGSVCIYHDSGCSVYPLSPALINFCICLY